MTDHVLTGCRSTPLLSYLKALGVARLVHRVDPAVRLWWGRDGFAYLRTALNRDALLNYFIDGYEPSPIVSPWNLESGFFPGKFGDALHGVEASVAPRLVEIRTAIENGRAALTERHLELAPKGADKDEFIEGWRAGCPESCLEWLDAAWGLTEEKPRPNPLLVSGGVDSRFEFARNFVERLEDCLPQLFAPQTETDRSTELLVYALFDRDATKLDVAAVGMFSPGRNGLPNSSSSASSQSISSPWDYVLLMEGSLAFAGGVSRQLGAAVASFPFAFRGSAVRGRGADSESPDKLKGEAWLPIWHSPAPWGSIQRLLAEGRAQDGREQSRSGRHLVRALADLGVERGIASFERTLIAQRNGQSSAAVSLGRVDVRSVPGIGVMRAADRWLATARTISSSYVRETVDVVDRAAYAVASGSAGASIEEWLRALARVQVAVGGRAGVRDRSARSHVAPLGGLPKDLVFALDSSPEVRLARSIAALGRGAGQSGLRSLIEPVEVRPGGWFQWSQNVRGATAAGLRHSLTTMARLAQIDATNDELGRGGASIRDALAFLSGGINEQRLIELAFAFTLCVPAPLPQDGSVISASGVDRLYAVCRLATVLTSAEGRESGRPPARDVIPALAAGQPERALRAAMRHLRSAGCVPLKSLVDVTATRLHAQRVAAALAIPIRSADLERLGRVVFVPPTEHEGTTP